MCMGVYYANLSIVQFRAMMLGVHVYVSNNPAHHPPYIRRMPNVTAYMCFLLIHKPEDGHKRRNM